MTSSRRGRQSLDKKAASKKKAVPKKKTATKKKNALKKKAVVKKKAVAKKAFIVEAGMAALELAQDCGPLAGPVKITYDLTTSALVEVESVAIAESDINLDADQIPGNPHKFATSGTKKYDGTKRTKGVSIIVIAQGKAGDQWSLNVFLNGKALPDNPIEKEPDSTGAMDHDGCHKLPA